MNQVDLPELPLGYVLDASALLAVLNREPGAGVVAPLLGRAAISSVNWTEVLQRAIALGMEVRDVREELESLGLRVLPFTAEDAEPTARLWPITRRVGLPLGDRACLSLAQRLGLPAFTAERIWPTLDLGVEVRLIR